MGGRSAGDRIIDVGEKIAVKKWQTLRRHV